MNRFKTQLLAIALFSILSACHTPNSNSAAQSFLSAPVYKNVYGTDTVHSLTSRASILLNISPIDTKDLPANMKINGIRTKESYSSAGETIVTFDGPYKTTITEKQRLGLIRSPIISLLV